MKKLILPLLIGSALLAQPAFAAEHNRAISYLTSWGVDNQAEKEIARSKVDTLLLSFGRWEANGDIHISDGITEAPTDSYWIPSAYLSWTQFKFDNPQRKVMVAFGGQTYESIWSYLQTAENREKIAQNLAELLQKNLPVYKRLNGQNQYTQVGTTQLDGIDFDFEKGARVTAEENANLLDLVKRLRQKIALLPTKKLLSLTTYHVGADPIECANAAVTQDCSYIEPSRSPHNGEVLPLLKNGKDVFDFFNVMAYDAGKRFKYDVAMANYARAVGTPAKIVLGATINQQWGPEGSFVENYQNNIERAAWQARNNYGGFFVWTLGSNTQSMPFAEQVNYINHMKEAAEEAAGTEDLVKPSTPTALQATVNNGSISLNWKASTDNIAVTGYQIHRNGSNYSTTTSTQWTDPSALAGVEYRYFVKARDAAGNLSTASNEVKAKIESTQEQVKPNAPTGLSQLSATSNSLSIKWQAVSNTTIKHYQVWRDGIKVKTVTATQFQDTGLAAGKTYTYYVTAESDKGLISSASSTLKAKTQDEQIVTPGPSEGDWKVGVNYKVGEIVTYQGKKYRCLQAHPAMAHWNPAAAGSLWQLQ